MKISLEQKEIENILLAWARTAVPNAVVNTVEFDLGYGTLRQAEISLEEPPKEAA